ncbi:hypothetical protein [Octadecabacter antarcticus]|nr:hypothetical protein [Octadecabacter antarcticus]
MSPSFGLEDIEKATGLDVAGLMIEHLENTVTLGATKTKSKV